MANKKRSYARYTLAAAQLIGKLIHLERKTRKMPAQDLAERIGITRGTLHRLEQGDPKVELGIAFEACTILGIRLFDDDLRGITFRDDEASKRLALLPRYARPSRPGEVDNDF